MEFYQEEHDGITMIAVQGDIDGSTSGEMQDYLVPVIVPNCRILLNVSQVSYMSSAGLRVMTLIYRRTKEQNGTLVETVQEGLEALAV
jgi:anti-sigma B factor antagonist